MTASFKLFADLLVDKNLTMEQVRDYMLKNPLLFSSNVIKFLMENVGDFQEEKTYVSEIIDYLTALQNAYAEALDKYPFGMGPLERLYNRVAEKEISLVAAMDIAMSVKMYGLISPLYVDGITRFLEELIIKSPQYWSYVVDHLRLLLFVLENTPLSQRNDEYEQTWSITINSWLQIVSLACHNVPDGRIFAIAAKHGKELAEKKLNSDKPYFAAFTLHRLGVLYLDPYFAGRSVSNYKAQYDAWKERFENYYGKDLINKYPELVQMPDPIQALESAVYYLSKAFEVGEGITKGRAAKALAESYYWKKGLNGENCDEQLIFYCKQGISLFQPAQNYVQEHTVLLNLLKNANQDLAEFDEKTPPDLSFILNASIDEILAKYATVKAYDVLHQLIHFYLEKDIQVAKTLWLKNKELMDLHFSDQWLLPFHLNGLRIIRYLYADNWQGSLTNKGFAALRNEAAKQSAAEHWTELKLTAVTISICFSSVNDSEEHLGLTYMPAVLNQLKYFPELVDFSESLLWLKAILHVGHAVNMLDIDKEDSVLHYGMALEIYLVIGSSNLVNDILTRFEEMQVQADEGLSISIMLQLVKYAVGLEQVGGLRARNVCQSIYQLMMANLYNTFWENELFMQLILQYAKGFGFSAAINGQHKPILQEPKAKKLLDRIAELQQGMSLEDRQSFNNNSNNELILSAYIGENNKNNGNSRAEVIENLQMEFDELCYQQLLKNTSDMDDFFLPPEVLKSAINSNTLLMIQYLGLAPTGGSAIYTCLITKESTELVMGLMNEDSLTVDVAKTRKEVAGKPYGYRKVSDEGKQLLMEDSERYLGEGLQDLLSKFSKEGKDHLCIVPHGALHFYPFHLLPLGNGLVADHWKVTYLPSIKLIEGRSFYVSDQSKALNSFGLSFSNSPFKFLAPLVNAPVEANKIAAIYSTKAFIDEMATEQVFMTALQNSKRVHIASHGNHNINAPAFQCLYAYPDEKSDGIIHAYEFMGLNLRGLDMVTLSACETALGRIDSADNLRGIPAILLSEGVATIVGTLWEAGDASCELFFTTFYTKLKENIPKYEAFYRAQQITRENYPEYREWGAFYLTGKFN